jgi:hypothetical protein
LPIASTVKYAEAAARGWTVLRVSPRQIRKGEALDWVKRCLAKEDH